MSIKTHILERHINPNAPLIVMINGILADYQSFDGAAFYGREYAHVLRYNCRGQDQCPLELLSKNPLSQITLCDHVNDLKELLLKIVNELPGVTSVFLVGLSNGGRISLKFAEDDTLIRKFNVKAVIAMDTYDELSPLLVLKLRSWYEATLVGGALHRFDVATPWIWGESFFKEKEDVILSYRQKIIENADAKTAMDVLGLLRGALKNESKEDRIDLSKLHVPVLLVAGDEDLLTTPAKHQEMLGKIKNGEFKIISKMGHAGLIENPMVMKNEIIPFIKTVLSGIIKD